MSSLKKKTFNNVAFNAIARVVAVVFQAMANIILSRSLLSSDYGIVGFANIFVNFFMQFSELGLNSAVVQRKELDDKALYTGFTMKICIGVSIYIIAFFASWAAVYFFDNGAVVNVIKVLGFNFVINCFGFIPLTLLKRDLDYKKISIANITQTIFNSLLAMVLALAGYKYWSIVLANLLATTAMVVALNVLKPIKIKFMFDKTIAKELMGYGTSLSLTTFTIFLLFNVDNFIIGSVNGSSSLGYYMIAFNWGSIICVMLGSVVNTVLFPTFSRMDQDVERIKRSYLRVLEYVSFIGILANLTLFVVSRDFLVNLLGHGTDKWIPALVSLQILCFYGIFRFLLEPLGNVLMALGLTKLMLKANVFAAVTEILLLYPVLKFYGIEGVAVLVTLTYTSQYLVYFPVIKKKLNLSFLEFIQPILPALITGMVVVIIFKVVDKQLLHGNTINMLLNMLLVVSLFTVLHGLATRWKLVREAKELMSRT